MILEKFPTLVERFEIELAAKKSKGKTKQFLDADKSTITLTSLLCLYIYTLFTTVIYLLPNIGYSFRCNNSKLGIGTKIIAFINRQIIL